MKKYTLPNVVDGLVPGNKTYMASLPATLHFNTR